MNIGYIDNSRETEFQKLINAAGIHTTVSIDHFYEKRKRWYNRYIQFSSSFDNDLVHYELVPVQRDIYCIELHIERCDENTQFLSLYKELLKQTREDKRISWYPRQQARDKGCRYLTQFTTTEEMVSALKVMTDIFEDKLLKLKSIRSSLEKNSKYNKPLVFESIETESNDRVFLASKSLKEILSYNITIPEYQRIYCWEDKQIKDLWKDIRDAATTTQYHLGSIILQRHKKQNGQESYDLIDGQQRLVTLSLILNELNYSGQIPLLCQRFKSSDAIKHIMNSKAVIEVLLYGNTDNFLAEKLVEKLQFSVLVINDDRLDIAYTFFSSQNSKGVPLSDYDLLKAHHLRYIFVEAQSEHLARRWNNLSQQTINDESYLETTLGEHLFRMRKWMRRTLERTQNNHQVKEEFSAAPMIEGIPPFGERFYFYDKIQGGTHFFAYADHFVSQFKNFLETQQASLLRKHLLSGRFWVYAQVIETLLFAYYLKFGKQYLSEALFCISSVIAQHRYTVNRAIRQKIMEYAHESELIMMIDQASSPTFFLAESMSQIYISGQDQEEPVKYIFYKCLSNIFRSLQDISEESIKNKIKDEYN